MSRVARVIRPGTFQHVISRFVDRDWYLVSEDERSYYLALLGRALEHSDWLCVAYCLMSNHLHFGLIAGEQPLDAWAKRVNSPFAQWLNKQRGRLGPIFADRPTSFEVPRERELAVVAYIHNNPVRAKVVSNAGDSTWSSHKAYIGRARAPRWLDVDSALARLGFAANPTAFDETVRGVANTKLEFPDLKRARMEARKEGQLEIGTPRLAEPIEIPIVCPPFGRRRPTIPAVIDAVASRLGVSADFLQRRYMRGSGSAAKRLAVHAASALGLSVAQMATALDVTRQRGSKIAITALTVEERAMLKDILEELAERSCAAQSADPFEGCQS